MNVGALHTHRHKLCIYIYTYTVIFICIHVVKQPDSIVAIKFNSLKGWQPIAPGSGYCRGASRWLVGCLRRCRDHKVNGYYDLCTI